MTLAIKPSVPVLQANQQAAGLAYFAVCYEGAGTILHDLAAGANLTIASGVWGTGQFTGPDLNIAGMGGNVAYTASSIPGFAQTGDFSVSCWVKLTANTQQSFASAYDSASAKGWAFGCDDANSGKLKFYTANGVNNHTGLSTSTISTGAWHHVAVTWNNASKNKLFYIDGVLDNTVVASSSGCTFPGTYIPAVGGAVNAGPSVIQPTLGQLDALAIYNYVLPVSGGMADSVAGIFADPFVAVRPPPAAQVVTNEIIISDICTETLTFGTVAAINVQSSSIPKFEYSNGTVAAAIDQHWEHTYTLAGSATVTLVLSALTDDLGRTIAFARVKRLSIQITAKTSGDVLVVGNAATNPITSLMSGTTPTYVIRLYDLKVAADSTGFLIGAGTSDQLLITNSGSHSMTFIVAISGNLT